MKMNYESRATPTSTIDDLAHVADFRFDTIRRRMQVQNLHVPVEERLSSVQQFSRLVTREGLKSLYRGLTPELLKVVSHEDSALSACEQAESIVSEYSLMLPLVDTNGQHNVLCL